MSRLAALSAFDRQCLRFGLRAICVLLLMTVLGIARSEPHETSSSTDSLMQQGAEEFERGAFSEALAHWKQAADRYKAEGNTSAQVEALVLSSQASLSLGRSQQALQSLELALALAGKQGDPLVEASVLGQLGRTYLALRRLTEALEYLDRAAASARKQGSSPLTATILNDLGVVFAFKQQDKEALEAFQESVTHAQKAKLPLLAATARTNAARTLLRLGQPTNSRLALDAALDHLQELPPSHRKSLGLIAVALAYQRLISQLPQMHDPLLLRAAGPARGPAPRLRH